MHVSCVLDKSSVCVFVSVAQRERLQVYTDITVVKGPAAQPKPRVVVEEEKRPAQPQRDVDDHWFELREKKSVAGTLRLEFLRAVLKQYVDLTPALQPQLTRKAD
jgi:hypothetical protein